MSDAPNWSRVRDVFSRALDLDPPLRPAYVREACGDDDALHAEVSSLLAAHADAGSIAEGSPFDALDASAVSALLGGLRAGDRLGPFDIVGPLGGGGMAEVYEARDTRLDRRVAIKVPSSTLMLDAFSRDRFVREAKALAALNHPNIAAIHGVETIAASGAGENPGIAIVMEFIDGETLARRVTRGPVPIAEVVRIGAQIAAALAAAHDQGIVHRDLKPANVMVTSGGVTKVLDFGLAKPLHRDRSANHATATVTTPGTILGTPAYMSPEQVRGEDVDRRTDVWAFGCVLFELLTGRRPFGGNTASECVAAVLEREPDWLALPPATPTSIRSLLRRCLRKDVAERLRDIGDARFALDDVSVTPDVTPKTRSATRQRMTIGLLGLMAAALAVLAVPAFQHFREAPRTEPSETRLDIVIPPTAKPKSFALSPDGRQIAFVASDDKGSRLWVRSLAATNAQPLPGTEGAAYPFWSPNNRSLGFFADSKLKRVDLIGGTVRTLAPVAVGLGGTWNADGVIVFAPSQSRGLMRVSDTGDALSPVTTLDAQQRGHIAPYFLPDGRRLLFSVIPAAGTDGGGIYLGSLDGDSPKRLTPARKSGVYLSSGWLLWILSGTQTLVARRLDLATAALTGDPVTVAEGVGSAGLDDGVSAVSVAATGLVAYRTAREQRQLVWVDRSGSVQGTLGDSDSSTSEPRVSPDGRRVAVTRIVQGNSDIWLLDGHRASRFTFDAAAENRAVWSPDGTRIAFRSERAGLGNLYVKPTDGSTVEEPLVVSDQSKNASSWSAHGNVLMFWSIDPQTGADLWIMPLIAGGKPSVFLKKPSRETQGIISPDGRWVVYQSDEFGERPEIWVRPFVRADAVGAPQASQWPVSTEGGIAPVWRSDGREVFFLNPAGGMMAAPVTVRGAMLEPGPPVLLFPTRIVGGGNDALQGRQYDVAADGRFLVNTEVDTAAPITLLMNWNPRAKE